MTYFSDHANAQGQGDIAYEIASRQRLGPEACADAYHLIYQEVGRKSGVAFPCNCAVCRRKFGPRHG